MSVKQQGWAFLAKPIHRESFLSVLDQWLKPGGKGGEPGAEQEPAMDGPVLDKLGKDVGIEVILELITNFGEDLVTSNSKIDARLAVYKLEVLARLAHKLKGSASPVGQSR